MFMLKFLVRRLAPFVLLAIAVPVARTVVRHLARAVFRHVVAKPAARALREADSTVTDVSRRASRQARQLTPAGR